MACWFVGLLLVVVVVVVVAAGGVVVVVVSVGGTAAVGRKQWGICVSGVCLSKIPSLSRFGTWNCPQKEAS